ncbi:MAG: hypothetical protein WCT05_10670, partial [Lentisphaeria bacterium]
QAAGAHVYAEPEVPIYAAGNLLAVHSANSGPLTLTIPGNFQQATELFTGKTYPVNSGRLLCQLQEPDTLFFALK